MKRIGGVLAGIILASSGAVLAAEGQQQSGQQPQTGQTGGSGMEGQQAGTQQLQGRVVRAGTRELYIEHMGAVVPVRLDEQTQYQGGISGARDIKEGQQVQVSFEVQNQTQNVARTVKPSKGGGGQ
jgi:hypothetical protein